MIGRDEWEILRSDIWDILTVSSTKTRNFQSCDIFFGQSGVEVRLADVKNRVKYYGVDYTCSLRYHPPEPESMTRSNSYRVAQRTFLDVGIAMSLWALCRLSNLVFGATGATKEKQQQLTWLSSHERMDHNVQAVRTNFRTTKTDTYFLNECSSFDFFEALKKLWT